MAWDIMDEEETPSVESAKARSPQINPVSRDMESDVVVMMRMFLTAQSSQEEGLIYELRGLREALQCPATPETSPSRSIHLDLPHLQLE